ncbi:hypothetical protein [Elioraea thermophila]|uniref:hypothetical protein n=1 Tax=Elioraea thermophila TaxID=2185104 RepID=UPI000DF2BC78|nr:hypothetical protein [Elioraea thermophila]
MDRSWLLAVLVVAVNVGPVWAQADGAVAEILRRAGVAPIPGAVMGTDPKARASALDALERTYPLPPDLRDRENTVPPDREAVMDRLGLTRHPDAPVVRMTDRTPTRAEIVDALAGR